MPPSPVQLVVGRRRFVVARTPNKAPTRLVKENWEEPLVSFVSPSIRGGMGTGTLIFTMPLVLGIPFTNTVASAKPGGKFHSGREANELVDQFVESRKAVWPLSMLRNWTSG